MDPNRKITKKFTKKFDSKVINRQYFHRKTGLQSLSYQKIKMQNLTSFPVLVYSAAERAGRSVGWYIQ